MASLSFSGWTYRRDVLEIEAWCLDGRLTKTHGMGVLQGITVSEAVEKGSEWFRAWMIGTRMRLDYHTAEL